MADPTTDASPGSDAGANANARPDANPGTPGTGTDATAYAGSGSHPGARSGAVPTGCTTAGRDEGQLRQVQPHRL